MPGVPASGACDACRKQKKKCDEAKPACSRCARLRIPCIGAGTQRYKFLAVNGRRSHGATQMVTTLPAAQQALGLVTMPYNATTKLTHQLQHTLSVHDVRYDLSFTYGPILNEIPKRLGESAVLDHSVSALIATMSDLTAHQRSIERFKHYGLALAQLRTSLQDPETALSPLTLLAILVIWICQGWLGGDQSNSSGHSSGVLAYLSRSPLRFSDDAFDQRLLGTVLAAVMFEAAFDSTVKMDPWMQDMLRDKINPKKRSLSTYFLEMPNLVRFDPSMLATISEYYTAIMDECQEPFDPPQLPQQQCSGRFSARAITCGIAIALNAIMSAYNPDDMGLHETSARLHNDIISLASQAEQFLPLGAIWIPVALEFAWVAQTDSERRAEVKWAWEQYWTPFSGAPFGVPRRFEAMFNRLRSDAAVSYKPSRSKAIS